MSQILKMLPQSNAGTSLSIYYTVPNDTTCILKEIILCNTTDEEATITMHIVKSGENASTLNMIFNKMQFVGAETKAIGLSSFLNEGSSIYVLSDKDGAICITTSVVEVT